MQSLLIQNLRHRLQKRLQKFETESVDAFLIYLKQFWLFFDNSPIYVGIMEQLVTKFNPELDEVIRGIFEQGARDMGESEERQAATGYLVLRKLSTINQQKVFEDIAFRYGSIVGSGVSPTIKKPSIRVITLVFLNPFFEYLDEQLDEQKIILSLLIRYKHRSEWFHREQLQNLIKNDSGKAEKLLALNFYSYLYDQGLDFMIEPSSNQGKIDIVATQNTKDPLLADAKIFDPDSSRGKRYIRKAFNQIYTYTQQYNEPFGYLVIFKNTDTDLCFLLSNTSSSVPVVTYNYKSIFFITIDIYENPKYVSQRDPLKMIKITEEELIQSAEDSETNT
jgi:hypothetical protein